MTVPLIVHDGEPAERGAIITGLRLMSTKLLVCAPVGFGAVVWIAIRRGLAEPAVNKKIVLLVLI